MDIALRILKAELDPIRCVRDCDAALEGTRNLAHEVGLIRSKTICWMAEALGATATAGWLGLTPGTVRKTVRKYREDHPDEVLIRTGAANYGIEIRTPRVALKRAG